MAFRIKTIKDADKPRAYVTIEHVDGNGDPTGRELTEPFDMQKKDWAGLKLRFKAKIDVRTAKDAEVATIINEGNNANLTNSL